MLSSRLYRQSCHFRRMFWGKEQANLVQYELDQRILKVAIGFADGDDLEAFYNKVISIFAPRAALRVEIDALLAEIEAGKQVLNNHQKGKLNKQLRHLCNQYRLTKSHYDCRYSAKDQSVKDIIQFARRNHASLKNVPSLNDSVAFVNTYLRRAGLVPSVVNHKGGTHNYSVSIDYLSMMLMLNN